MMAIRNPHNPFGFTLSQTTARWSPRPMDEVVTKRLGIHPAAAQLLVSGICLAIAWTATALTDQITHPSFTFFFLAITLSAWFGGHRTGWLTTELAVMSTGYFILLGAGSPSAALTGAIQIAAFLGVSLLIVHLVASRDKLAIQLHALSLDLDRRLAARTAELEERIDRNRRQVELLDLAPGAILTVDFSTGLISFWSAGAEKLYGWSKAEAEGRRVQDLLHPRFGTRIQEIYAELKRNDRWEGELIQTRRDGSELTVYSQWALQRDAAGAPVAIVGVDTDLSLHRQVEQERAGRVAAEAVSRRTALLAASSRAFAASGLDAGPTLDAVAHWIAVCIGDGCVIRLVSDDGQWLEPAASYHTDPELRELLHDFVREVARPTGGALIQEVMASRAPRLVPVADREAFRARLPAPARPYVDALGFYSLLLVPLRVQDRLIGVVGAMRSAPDRPYTLDDQALLQNVADRAALAIENARLYEQAVRALELRDQFLAEAAHELKTPVTGLQLAAQVLATRAARGLMDVQVTQELASRIEQQSLKLGRLVTELLDVSRFETGRLVLRPERADLVRLTRTAIDAHQALDQLHPIMFEAPPELMADVDVIRVEQVLVNLLDNARKFSPPETTIEVRVEKVADRLASISVRDHGVGISEADRERIFERFYQAQAHRQTAGLGLGLFISRQIVELHGGELSVERPPDGGTCFVITLPVS